MSMPTPDPRVLRALELLVGAARVCRYTVGTVRLAGVIVCNWVRHG